MYRRAHAYKRKKSTNSHYDRRNCYSQSLGNLNQALRNLNHALRNHTRAFAFSVRLGESKNK